jgi:hypothetical protein
MEELIIAVKNWPVLVQGALGSALFWLLLVIGQKMAALLSDRWGRISQASKRTKLRNELFRHRALRSAGNIEVGAPYAVILTFRASRPFFKGLI